VSFKQRQINLQFSGNGETLSLEGLRCAAMIMNPGGFNGFGSLELRVYGMTLAQMNQYSSTGSNQVATLKQSVTVSAGNVGETIAQVFQGTLLRSYIDFSAVPDSCFVCAAQTGLFDKTMAAAPLSLKGAQNAEDIIKSLAARIGFTFVNKNSAHAVVQNQYASGSIVDQIQTVARAAALPVCFENNSVIIWPNNGVRDGVVIDVSPQTGMVGYPSYWEAGFVVKTEFNPLIANGRTVKLTSSIPKSNGSWPTQNVLHELSTQASDGPWFTTARLSPANYVPRN